jgi:hypothetical protein
MYRPKLFWSRADHQHKNNKAQSDPDESALFFNEKRMRLEIMAFPTKKLPAWGEPLKNLPQLYIRLHTFFTPQKGNQHGKRQK